MKLTPRRINVEDLKGAPNWAPPLVNSINLSQEDVVSTVNGKLEIGTNVSGQIYSVSFTTPSNYSTGGFPTLSFNFTGAIRPQVLLVGNISQTKPVGVILTSQSAQWSYNNNVSPPSIKVNYVSGLLPSTTYNITFLAL